MRVTKALVRRRSPSSKKSDGVLQVVTVLVITVIMMTNKKSGDWSDEEGRRKQRSIGRWKKGISAPD